MSAWAERRARLRARHPRLKRMNDAFYKRGIVVIVSRWSAVPSAEPSKQDWGALSGFFEVDRPPSAEQGPKAKKTHPREVRRVLSARTRRASEAKKPALDLQAPSMAQGLLQAAPSTQPPPGFHTMKQAAATFTYYHTRRIVAVPIAAGAKFRPRCPPWRRTRDPPRTM